MFTDETKEIFYITQEECAEVTQALSKVLRFGLDSKNPVTSKTNKESLEEELGDLLGMIDLIIQRCLVSDNNVNYSRQQKKTKLQKWSNINFKTSENESHTL